MVGRSGLVILACCFMLCSFVCVQAQEQPKSSSSRQAADRTTKTSQLKSAPQQKAKSLEEMEADLKGQFDKLRKIENETRKLFDVPADTDYVWITEVTREDDGIFFLANGGIVKKESIGYVGYIGYHQKCFVYGYGRIWHIGLKGREYRCEVIERPRVEPIKAAKTMILQNKGSGRILELIDGSLWEVSSVDASTTSVWLGGAMVLLLDDLRMLNLDTGETVPVKKN